MIKTRILGLSKFFGAALPLAAVVVIDALLRSRGHRLHHGFWILAVLALIFSLAGLIEFLAGLTCNQINAKSKDLRASHKLLLALILFAPLIAGLMWLMFKFPEFCP